MHWDAIVVELACGSSYACRMQAAASTPWMLVPGHMCDARMWSGVLPALRESGLQTLFADLGLDDRVGDMARRALDSLDCPAVVVGFSMGGMVALRMKAMAPGRIAGLVLIDTNARPDLPERALMRREQQRRVRDGKLAQVVREELLPHYFRDTGARDPALAALVEEMAIELGPEVFIRQSEAIRLRPDARSELAQIRCPTIVIGGLEDRLSAAEWQRDLASGIEAADLVLLPNVGHFAPLEAPDALVDALLSWGGRHGLA